MLFGITSTSVIYMDCAYLINWSKRWHNGTSWIPMISFISYPWYKVVMWIINSLFHRTAHIHAMCFYAVLKIYVTAFHYFIIRLNEWFQLVVVLIMCLSDVIHVMCLSLRIQHHRSYIIHAQASRVTTVQIKTFVLEISFMIRHCNEQNW